MIFKYPDISIQQISEKIKGNILPYFCKQTPTHLNTEVVGEVLGMVLQTISDDQAGNTQWEVLSLSEVILPTLIVALSSSSDTGASVTVVGCRQFYLRTSKVLF